jgi:DNA-binding IclR family transcriptional regulator
MAGETLPTSVQQFLSKYVRSLEQLEVLLLLRNSPNRSWTSAEVYEVVRSSRASVEERLESFVQLGFLAKENGPPTTFRYAPTESLGAAVDETASAYQKWRVRVIEAIFTPVVDPAQRFADAFKVRKE